MAPQVKRTQDGADTAVRARLMRCADGEDVWSAEATGSWDSQDDKFRERVAQYVQQLGPEVEPYAVPTYKLLKATLDTLQANLTTQFKLQLDASNAALSDSVRADTAQKLAGVDAIAARAVADASPALSNAALATIRPEIAAAAQKMLSDAQAALGSAIAANSDALRAEINGQFASAQAATTTLIGSEVDREVELSSEVNPDILGGVVLRVGNVILDASIKNRLEQLRKQVAQA